MFRIKQEIHAKKTPDPTEKSFLLKKCVIIIELFFGEKENSNSVDKTQVHEKNRTSENRSSNRYIKRIKYGNQTPNRDDDWNATDPNLLEEWLFEVVFDHNDGHYEILPFDSAIPEREQHQYIRANIEGAQKCLNCR